MPKKLQIPSQMPEDVYKRQAQGCKNAGGAVIHHRQHPVDMRPLVDVGHHGRYAGAGFREGAGLSLIHI